MSDRTAPHIAFLTVQYLSGTADIALSGTYETFVPNDRGWVGPSRLKKMPPDHLITRCAIMTVQFLGNKKRLCVN
ncbi:hypothetical protein H4S08_000627 [Coemansia sp. RSA 1365]|nr:hypothetical protein H4S08_000627 [Coemansia sp. RSA 1365]